VQGLLATALTGSVGIDRPRHSVGHQAVTPRPTLHAIGGLRSDRTTWPLLSPAEVAEIAGVSRKTIYREVERDELPVRHVGRQLRIDPADFDRYLERSGP
jgi:excisionase family DNA binding protein